MYRASGLERLELIELIEFIGWLVFGFRVVGDFGGLA